LGVPGQARAYDLLDELRTRLNRRVDPPTVYRALDFLIAQNLVHRVESTNAYLPVPDPACQDALALLICTSCGASSRLSLARIEGALGETVAATGFRIRRKIIEFHGLCAACTPPCRAEAG